MKQKKIQVTIGTIPAETRTITVHVSEITHTLKIPYYKGETTVWTAPSAKKTK